MDNRKVSRELRERREKQLAARRSGNIGHVESPLNVPEHLLDRETFSYRLMNDRPGRIAGKTQNDTWEVVKSDDGTVDFHSGTDVRGESVRTYLMRKPREWFDEDKAERQEAIDRRMNDIKGGTVRGESGPQDQAPFYTPKTTPIRVEE